jgi:hypothetical protein
VQEILFYSLMLLVAKITNFVTTTTNLIIWYLVFLNQFIVRDFVSVPVAVLRKARHCMVPSSSAVHFTASQSSPTSTTRYLPLKFYTQIYVCVSYFPIRYSCTSISRSLSSPSWFSFVVCRSFFFIFLIRKIGLLNNVQNL